MRTRIAGAVLAGSIGAAAVLLMREPPHERADLRAARGVVADILRDSDQLMLKVTRASDTDEIAEGERIAASQSLRPEPDGRVRTCADRVGRRVAAHAARRGLPYSFTVVSGEAANAFALPGGRVYISSALVWSFRSEDELAAVLGHEISHIDLRHAIERRQMQVRAARAGVRGAGRALDALRTPWITVYSADQEMDADVNGLRLAAGAGYDAAAGVRWMARQATGGGARPRPRTLVEEAVEAVADEDYWRSHPPMRERVARARRAAAYLQAGARPAPACSYELWNHASR